MEIRDEELRVDNYVYSVRHDMIVEIHSVMPSKIKLWCNPLCLYELTDIKPIPLTEEILLKIGFEKSSIYDNTYYLNFCTLNGRHELFIDIRANVVIIGTIEIANFNSLHQLQNLIFNLTGQELNVKL